MEKTIFYCKKCNTTYSATPGSRLTCDKCRSELIDTGIPVTQWREMTAEEKEERKTQFKDTLVEPTTSSGIGYSIKLMSIIVGSLCVFGGLIIGSNISWPVGIAVVLVEGLFALIAYGIGEICDRLQSIDNKIR